MLDDRSVDRLSAHVFRLLKTAPFGPPFLGETEPHFVARVVAPHLRQSISSIKLLRVEGEGIGRPRPTRFLGAGFYPDLVIMHEQNRLIAVEAKYIPAEPDSAQNAIATALGQAAIYRLSGYRRAGVMFLSWRNIDQDETLSSLLRAEKSLGEAVIYRKIQATGLSVDPTTAFASRKNP